ncbi:MAG TPA: glycosyltransferase family 4 protein [Pirellulaceae bacterium]|nr:glycosyltransferase family 4 protein [Pirellulaceae bacterium]HMP68582.1 glycosyltransferase family 4 protein [Pirellulaceae bacterium]
MPNQLFARKQSPVFEVEQQRLKILQIVSGTDVNGAVIYCGLLARRLSSLGHQVTVMIRPQAWFQERFRDESFALTYSTLDRNFAEVKRVCEFVKREKFDLVHTHMSSAHSFGVILKYLTGIPCIATAHQCSLQLHWCLNDYVIANSRATRTYQQRVNCVLGNRIEAIHCFSDLQPFAEQNDDARFAVRRQFGIPDDALVVGLVGNICKRKGQYILVQALPELIRRYPKLVVLFVGSYAPRNSSYMRRVRGYLVKHQLFRRVRWLGRKDDIPAILKSCDISIIPSLEEPLGLAAIESLASGVPTVASDVGGLPEIIEHRKTGLLIPPGDPLAITQSISEYVEDRDRALEMAELGRSKVLQQFDQGVLTEQVERVYRRVLQRRSTILEPEFLPLYLPGKW